MDEPWILPEWPAPARIRALATTRPGGCSLPPYDRFNLGDHVGDDPVAVAANRRLLRDRLDLPAEPLWLHQVHGCGVAGADAPGCSGTEADASIALRPHRVCVVLTADCLPLLVCDRAGTRVAAIHAGWRGLAAGVIEATLARLAVPGPELLVWLGPAIGPRAFEVGVEVREAFVAQDPQAARAFITNGRGRWNADIYHLARRRLAALDVGFVAGGDCCTVSDPERFYSYRRDGTTGRMASLIWIDDR